ncbi:hypothetical protein PENTCL1PPCAC_13376 [Pristionchus entomophagus]|uniref:Uncharacterized protein n=1 Tax=Pristionchus entomophagus TaxID=358040 RepID=A0AAV5T6Q6_9BILA|nr:hypothetical protein PENTCL1PPCAC_13376 [Pristionchus entomophagus]
MSDEPSIPMDQEEEDNDEYFSARESLKRSGSQENLKSSKTPRSNRSNRDGRDVASPITPQSETSPSASSSRKSDRQQMFFSDEKAQQRSENSTKKSEKVKRLLKDKSHWDMREYKKEELEPPAKPKKKKKKTPKKKAEEKVEEKVEQKEKSKTDEETEQEEEKEPVKSSDRVKPPPRSFFQSEQLILRTKVDKPITPKCKYYTLRFAKTQEVVEYDSEGMQHQLPYFNERAISNPWRRWGAHRALCDQGGFAVDKNKKLVEIKRGSDPPPCPPNPRQVTLNKNCEAPDSQTMMGTLRVEVGPAEEEVHRIGRVMEDYVVSKGGFVPPPLTRKDMQQMAPRPVKNAPGQPVVVVQTKGGNQPPKDASAVKVKAKKKASKPKKNKKSGSESDNVTEDESTAEKGKKKEPKDDSKKGGGFGFFKRKKSQQPPKGKGRPNNKGSVR